MNVGSSLGLDPELNTGSGHDIVMGLARHGDGGHSKKRKGKDQSESCLHKDQARASDSLAPHRVSVYTAPSADSEEVQKTKRMRDWRGQGKKAPL